MVKNKYLGSGKQKLETNVIMIMEVKDEASISKAHASIDA